MLCLLPMSYCDAQNEYLPYASFNGDLVKTILHLDW